MEIAAESADVVYSSHFDIASGKAYYDDLKSRLAKYGREREALKVMPGVTLFIGRTRAEAQAKYDELNALVAPELGLSYLYQTLGDLSGFDIDGPVPEPPNATIKSSAGRMLALARQKNLTIRQLYQTITSRASAGVMVGTPKDIVDDMQAWVRAAPPTASTCARRSCRMAWMSSWSWSAAGAAGAGHVPHRIQRPHAARPSGPGQAAQPLRPGVAAGGARCSGAPAIVERPQAPYQGLGGGGSP